MLLISRYFRNHFLKCFLWTTWDLNSFQCFALLFQKTISNLALKNFQKTKKCHFQRFRAFVFNLKVASKPFFKKIYMTKSWFKCFLMLWMTFPINGFNFVAQKFAKNKKMLSSNVHIIRFWPQSSFKTIF